MCSEVQCVSDYVDLVCIRVLSRDIRRLLYWELLRCSGIHLDESALMTELRRDGAHLNKYCSSLIKQTTSTDLFHALSRSLSSCFFPLGTLFPLYNFPSNTMVSAVLPLTLPYFSFIQPYSSVLVLGHRHLPFTISHKSSYSNTQNL